jgi:hypothetical protein
MSCDSQLGKPMQDVEGVQAIVGVYRGELRPGRHVLSLLFRL